MKHKNIPVFIPHEGCPNDCIFCAQDKITGVSRSEKDIKAEVLETSHIIRDGISTLKAGDEAEIAFFGGSFTGIEKNRMIALLEEASRFIGGNIKGIRISTRPDYIDRDICSILKSYGVTSIELGIQSTDQGVLETSRRGHTPEDCRRACFLVSDNGFGLTGQMMTGLPGSDITKELQTAMDIISWGADSARIYPVVVFESTGLHEMVLDKSYMPLELDEAVERTAACALIFIKNNIKILKIGLHSSEGLAGASGGPSHPALGELVSGEIYYKIISEKIKGKALSVGSFTILMPKGELSKITGQNGRNRERIKILTGINNIMVKEDSSLEKYEIRMKST